MSYQPPRGTSPAHHVSPRPWTEDAACKGRSDLFDGANRLEKHNANQHHGLPILQWERDALAICAACPVWRECREWALYEYGCDEDVVGGLTGLQRRQIRRGRIPAPSYKRRGRVNAEAGLCTKGLHAFENETGRCPHCVIASQAQRRKRSRERDEAKRAHKAYAEQKAAG